jgi:hypothetical protein
MATGCFLCGTDWIFKYYLNELRIQRIKPNVILLLLYRFKCLSETSRSENTDSEGLDFDGQTDMVCPMRSLRKSCQERRVRCTLHAAMLGYQSLGIRFITCDFLVHEPIQRYYKTNTWKQGFCRTFLLVISITPTAKYQFRRQLNSYHVISDDTNVRGHITRWAYISVSMR